MIAVIFEVWIRNGKKDAYLDIASELKTELSKIDGFISVERFQSISEPKKLLSLSVWKDEQAVERWRNLEKHRNAQIKGIQDVFKDYRIRVGTILRDYGLSNREQSPKDSKSFHD